MDAIHASNASRRPTHFAPAVPHHSQLMSHATRSQALVTESHFQRTRQRRTRRYESSGINRQPTTPAPTPSSAPSVAPANGLALKNILENNKRKERTLDEETPIYTHNMGPHVHKPVQTAGWIKRLPPCESILRGAGPSDVPTAPIMSCGSAKSKRSCRGNAAVAGDTGYAARHANLGDATHARRIHEPQLAIASHEKPQGGRRCSAGGSDEPLHTRTPEAEAPTCRIHDTK